MAQTSAPKSTMALTPVREAPFLRSGARHIVLLVLILALGTFARTWEYGRLPPSLNPDEASTGVEALNLLRFGTDRNGITLPVKFISWGSGQDVLYAYLLIPFVAVLRLSPISVRLPMLLVGLITLPLIYAVTRRIFGAAVALVATLMLAVSPWHILLSRWALDSNLLPFVFLAGFMCMLCVSENGWWFVPACVLSALCLYAYGTAYMIVPTFMAGVIWVMARARALRSSQLWAGLVSFAVVAAPIGMLVVVNRLGLDSVRMGPFTVPSFPVAVRWESTTLLGTSDISRALTGNLATGLRLLLTESDGIAYNVVEPYGVFYRCALLLAVAGLVVMRTRREWRYEIALLALWLGSSAGVALMSAVNINRFNIVFLPLLILGARGLHQLQGLHRALGPLTTLGLLAAFSAFTLAYHGESYRKVADFKFQYGLIPAHARARGRSSGPICVTDKINMPYIYALFTDPLEPARFLDSVKYVDEAEPLRRVASFGRYTFGVKGCVALGDPTYVLTEQETPPRLGNRYSYEFIDNFVVYTPSR